ncbi:hypothetical protein [Streptosporangium sp. H16]|uniref:hypothetical protein n=1 Tax=Streptosporangium sp. H16 TaxID=3444184 RepID=UPI003F78FF6B
MSASALLAVVGWGSSTKRPSGRNAPSGRSSSRFDGFTFTAVAVAVESTSDGNPAAEPVN